MTLKRNLSNMAAHLCEAAHISKMIFVMETMSALYAKMAGRKNITDDGPTQ
jgi:hypothetical protein